MITDHAGTAERLRLLRSHGMTTLTWDRHRGHAASHDVVVLGFNYRIDEPRATLARARLARLDKENRRRGRLELLRGSAGVAPTAAPGSRLEPAHHLFTVVLDESADRGALTSRSCCLRGRARRNAARSRCCVRFRSGDSAARPQSSC